MNFTVTSRKEEELEKIESESKNIADIFDLIDELILNQQKLKQQLSKVGQ